MAEIVFIIHKGLLTLFRAPVFKELLELLCKICQLLINFTYA